MTTPQLLSALLAVTIATACSRAESDAKADRAAEQVRTVAAKAGHQFADSWLTTKIQAQYFADDDIKARHINVSTRNKVVTLTGYVDGEAQRDLAVQIARTTDGVSQVNDRLAIAREADEPGAAATSGAATPGSAADIERTIDDAEVTARVRSKYFVDEQVKARRIDVDTQDGVVTLTGEVASEDERRQALRLARTTEGVRRVEDHLTLGAERTSDPSMPAGRSPEDDELVTATIQAKYFVDPTVKTSHIGVSTVDGVVTLQGHVAEEAIRKQALDIAQRTEGVIQVVDRLTVTPPEH